MTRSSYWCALAAGLGLALPAGAGCGGARPVVKRENQRLEAKVAELRAQARRDRRKIRDLENEILVLEDELERAEDWEQEPYDEPLSPPELPVEKLEPERSAEAAPADEPPAEAVGVDSEGREIVYAGDALEEEPLRLDADHYDLGSGGKKKPPRRSSSEPPPSPGPLPEAGDKLPVVSGKVPALSEVRRARRPPSRSRKRTFGDPRSAYRRHFEALKRGDHAEAVSGFRNFLKRFPHHTYADNAQYWLGEAFYDQKQYKSALAEFQKVVEDFPAGNKVPDALLKVGYCRVQLDDAAGARAALERVVERYPKTNPAILAARKLEKLEE